MPQIFIQLSNDTETNNAKENIGVVQTGGIRWYRNGNQQASFDTPQDIGVGPHKFSGELGGQSHSDTVTIAASTTYVRLRVVHGALIFDAV